ncbi:MAG: HD-GYP domain-containing protein, partial [Moorellaceae bacterium]
EMVHIPDLRECRSKFRWPWQTDLENFASYTGVPLVFKDRLMGVLEFFYREPPCAPEYWAGFLETLAGQIAIALDNARLWEDLRNSHKELSQAYDATIEALVYAVDLRDKETEGHSRRVADLTVALGRMLGIKEEGLVHIRRGALLHDIGKLGVPDSILHKPGPLSEEEWVLMRRHPIYAYEMLWPIAHLRPALDIPYCHHEKWDGTGYPRGLKGEEIPLAARLFAIVDVWDALRSERPYRPPWPREKALAYIREQAGKHFDPELVKLFLRTPMLE